MSIINMIDEFGNINTKKLNNKNEEKTEDINFGGDQEERRPKKKNNIIKKAPDYKNIKIVKVESDKNNIPQRKLMDLNVIPKHPGVSLFVGSVGSGKSNLIVNLLSRPEFYGPDDKGDGYFDVVFLLTGADDDAYDVLIDKDIIKEQHIKFDPTADDIQRILDLQMKTIKKVGLLKAPKILIILEDIVDNKKLLNSSSFRSLFIKPRQHSLSIFLACQYLNLCPKGLRQQAINLFIFPQNRAGEDIICDQFCPGCMKKKEFMQVIGQCTEIRKNDTHPFMHINRRCKNNRRFRRNLDKIIAI